MKSLSILRCRRPVFVGILFAVLSFGATSQLIFSSAEAQTNAPAPSGAKAETDKLLELLQSNTNLTQQDAELTQQVADLAKQIHALLTKQHES